MAVEVDVTDPNRVISAVSVLAEGPDAVVLRVDLHEKRAEVQCWWGAEAHFPRDAVVTVRGLPFEGYRATAETVRYTCVLTFARDHPGREVYRGATKKPGSGPG